jgi:predicted transcriptional regulator
MRDSSLVFRRRRDSTKVIYEILSAVEKGGSKTRIIYAANLNFRLAGPYLEFLLSTGHLRRDVGGNGQSRYGLTGRGENLRRLLEQVEDELVRLSPG